MAIVAVKWDVVVVKTLKLKLLFILTKQSVRLTEPPELLMHQTRCNEYFEVAIVLFKNQDHQYRMNSRGSNFSTISEGECDKTYSELK